MQKLPFIIATIIIATIAFFAGWYLKPTALGVVYSGQIGVYNASGMTVENGNGSSIALDAYGRPKISTTTIISVITP